MIGLLETMTRPDTVRAPDLEGLIARLKAPQDALTRVTRLRCARDAYDLLEPTWRQARESGKLLGIHLDYSPFLPAGFVLGFSSREELLLIAGPKDWTDGSAQRGPA